ncbi:hypothetical protein MTX78_23185 (plasmid) [Hymenobacter tibetensis]|uniref:Uncharacterized protein n=1 Tax=Hymenobacter tibetensis TaxID=497967 RepID=A0ABY4D5N0_9BACT|nr:hypothetical protein [Hymenobacter tibetensis]UOG77334.1 hypothetical protein MTX78_23185 [Hymenobacter tibetensis]
METNLDLTTVLPLTNGALDLAAGSVPGVLLSDQISRLTNGFPLHIRDAVRTVEDNAVCIRGKAALLHLPSLPILLKAQPVDDEWEVTTIFTMDGSGDDSTLSLASLCQQLGVANPPALDIEEVTFVSDKTGDFSLAATMAKAPGWSLDLGPVPLTLADVELTFVKPKGGSASSAFTGSLDLGDALTLHMESDTDGALSLEAPLPTVKLSQLLRKFTSQSGLLPNAFDPTFEDGLVLIQRDSNNLVFRFATVMSTLGTVVFEAKRVDSAWGAVAGISLGARKVSDLPGLSSLKNFEKVFQLQDLVLVVSSLDDEDFVFPNLTLFDSPALSAGGLKLAAAGGILKGLNIYAKWQLDTSNKDQKLLRTFLGLQPSIAVVLQVGANPTQNSRLYVAYRTTIKGMELDCQFGGQLNAGKVSLFLTGELRVNIQGQPVRFNTTMLFVPNGAFLSGSMIGTVELPFLHLKLSNLGLAIGINAAAIPSVGFTATLSVDSFQSSLAVFLDSTDPSKSMLAGSVSDLTLHDVVTVFAQTSVPPELGEVLEQVGIEGTSDVFLASSVATALDNRELDTVAAALSAVSISMPSTPEQALLVEGEKGRSWFLTNMTTMLHYELVKQADTIRVRLNPQLYFAPQTTKIGALEFQQAFYINGKLKIFAFEAMVKIMVMPSKGIAVEGHMSPIIIGNANLFSILADSDPAKGPRISLATFSEAAPASALVPTAPPVATPTTPTPTPATAKSAPAPAPSIPYSPQTAAQAQGAAKSGALAYAAAAGAAQTPAGIPPSMGPGVPPAQPMPNVPMPNGSVPGMPYGGPNMPYGPAGMPYNGPGAPYGMSGPQPGAYGAPNMPYGSPGIPYGAPGQQYGNPTMPYGGAPGMPYSAPGMPYGTPGMSYGGAAGIPYSGAPIMPAPGMPYGGPGMPGAPYSTPGMPYGGPNMPYGPPNMPYGSSNAPSPYGNPTMPYGAPNAPYGGPVVPAPVAPVPVVQAPTLPVPTTPQPQGQKPHFTLDGRITLLGMQRGVSINVDSSGAVFSLTGGIAPGITANLRGQFTSQASMGVGGSLEVGLGSIDLGVLGSVNISTGVQGSLELGADKSHVWANFKGGVQFGGQSLTLPTVSLDVKTSSLLELPKKLLELVKAALQDIFKDAEKWAKYVMQSVVTGVRDIGAVLHQWYRQTAEQMAKTLKEAGYMIIDVTRTLQTYFNRGVQGTLLVLKSTGYAIDQIGNSVRQYYGLTAGGVASALQMGNYAVAEVGNYLKTGFGLSTSGIASALREGRYALNEVGAYMQTGFKLGASGVAEALKGGGYAVKEVGSYVQKGFNLAADALTSTLKDARFAAVEVASALQVAYGTVATHASALLKGVGYSAGEVGGALKGAYAQSEQQAAVVLRGVGYTADQVGSGLKSAYGSTAGGVAVALKGAGYAVNEVGGALKSAYGSTAGGVAVALKGAGYAVNEVGNFVKNGFGLGANDLRTALAGANFATDQVNGFFNSLGGSFADNAKNAVNTVAKGATNAANTVASGVTNVANHTGNFFSSLR